MNLNNNLRKTLWVGIKVFIIALALIPIVRVIIYLKDFGSNNISNDTFLIVPLISKVLDGTYHWADLFQDAFINDHFQFLTIIIHILIAKFFDLNVFIILGLGILLACLKLYFLFDAFTFPYRGPAKYIFLILLSFLIFSPSQIPTFESDWNTIMVGITQLGIAFGIWGLVKFRPGTLGVGIMVIGGVAACYSSAIGPLTWPAFFLGMILLNYRKIGHYLLWLFGALVGSWPYLYFNNIKTIHRAYDNPVNIHKTFEIPLMLKAIGWPFKQGMTSDLAYLVGWVGFIFCFSAIIILIRNRKQKEAILNSVASLILIFIGILSVLVVAIFRGGLTPWYATFFMPIWLGLSGLAFIFWEHRKAFHILTPTFWTISFISFISFFYFSSGLSFQSHAFFINQRTPASQSCLRNYGNAPTYCSQLLFSWNLNHYEEFVDFGKSLDVHRLSVFDPIQEWTLQGDFSLDGIKVLAVPGFPGVFWSRDRSNQAVSFFDPGHLNLFLHPPNAIEWRVTLPKNTKRAKLQTAVTISQSAPLDSASDGVISQIDVIDEEGRRENLISQYVSPNDRKWIPREVSLEQFAGQTITLRLGSDPIDNYLHDWAMFLFPRISIELDENKTINKENKAILPQNTELSPHQPQLTKNDFIFGMGTESIWFNKGMFRKGSPNLGLWEVLGQDPYIEFGAHLEEQLTKYSHIYIQVSAREDVTPRILQIYYKLNGAISFSEEKSIKIPLLKDDQVHKYYYDLKNLELQPDDKLTGIRMDPIIEVSNPNGAEFGIFDFRLVHKT